MKLAMLATLVMLYNERFSEILWAFSQLCAGSKFVSLIKINDGPSLRMGLFREKMA